MKKETIKSFIIIITFSLSFFSCESELDKKILLDYNLTSVGLQIIGDTIIIKKSVPCNFKFSGSYDFLVFYSGETGHEYAKRNLEVSPKEEINTSVLSFGLMPQYGIIDGTLRIFISETFPGLKLFDKKMDSTSIVLDNWIEISELCNLPQTSSQVLQSSLSLIDYCDKKVSFAFLYKTLQNTTSQPTWEIRDLKITNTMTNTSINTFKAVDLGFSALDMYNLNGQTATSGVWNLNSINLDTNPVMRIQSSPSGAPMNEDWLISTPTIINKRLPDTGIAINEISTNMSDFEYLYNNIGVFNASIIAKKANYIENTEIEKKLIFKVVE
jgi:hypothetical protein